LPASAPRSHVGAVVVVLGGVVVVVLGGVVVVLGAVVVGLGAVVVVVLGRVVVGLGGVVGAGTFEVAGVEGEPDVVGVDGTDAVVRVGAAAVREVLVGVGVLAGVGSGVSAEPQPVATSARASVTAVRGPRIRPGRRDRRAVRIAIASLLCTLQTPGIAGRLTAAPSVDGARKVNSNGA
jgi:hypothetical protein